jgi:hypothetical protein
VLQSVRKQSDLYSCVREGKTSYRKYIELIQQVIWGGGDPKRAASGTVEEDEAEIPLGAASGKKAGGWD